MIAPRALADIQIKLMASVLLNASQGIDMGQYTFN